VNQPRTTLSKDLLVSLERACREGEFEVAEHLLQAREAMERRKEQEIDMEHVYKEVANSLYPRRLH
jgi:hypothetical protein